MFPILIIGNAHIQMYTLCMGIGFATGVIPLYFRGKTLGIKFIQLLACYAIAGCMAILGGKVASMLANLPSYIAMATELGYNFFDLYNSAGAIFYGNMLAAILGVLLYCALYKKSFWKFIDAFLPLLPWVLAIWRIGCFCAGCCYGIPFEHGMYFTASSVAPHDVKLLPLQLIESAGCFAIFVILMLKGRKPLPKYNMMGLFFVLYPALRLVLEFFRGDEKSATIGIFSIQQWISVALVAVGILLLVYVKKKGPAAVEA
ncbi:MAG: prolipoprotein diacylglyceryl transferase [Christensenellaceae bacterium]|jgi:phosphatidylglycerol:prolipoprotein diacylglycerol transferase